MRGVSTWYRYEVEAGRHQRIRGRIPAEPCRSEGFWSTRRPIGGCQLLPRVLDRRGRRSTGGSRAESDTATTLSTAVRDGRGDQAALVYDSPVTGTGRPTPTEELRRRWRASPGRSGLGRGQGRPGRHLHADDSGGRWSPCWRVRGSGRSTRWCSAGSRRRSWRRASRTPAEGDRLGVVRDRAEPGHRVQADAGPGDRAGQHKPEPCVVLQRPAGSRGRAAGRDLDWAQAAAGPSPRTACRWRPPIRSTSSTPRAPRPGPRAWCGTTAGTRWRCGGACRTSTTPARATCSGQHPTWAGWSGTPTSSTGRCWPGAPRSCTRASRWARRTRARSGGWSPSTTSRHCSPRRRRSAPSRREDPRGELIARYDLSEFRHPVPGRRAAGPRDLPVGRRAARRPGHRPLVADRDRLADRGRPDGPRADAGQAGSPTVPVPGYDVRILDADGAEAEAA